MAYVSVHRLTVYFQDLLRSDFHKRFMVSHALRAGERLRLTRYIEQIRQIRRRPGLRMGVSLMTRGSVLQAACHLPEGVHPQSRQGLQPVLSQSKADRAQRRPRSPSKTGGSPAAYV